MGLKKFFRKAVKHGKKMFNKKSMHNIRKMGNKVMNGLDAGLKYAEPLAQAVAVANPAIGVPMLSMVEGGQKVSDMARSIGSEAVRHSSQIEKHARSGKGAVDKIRAGDLSGIGDLVQAGQGLYNAGRSGHKAVGDSISNMNVVRGQLRDMGFNK